MKKLIVTYCCPRNKLRVQGGWRHEWCKPECIVPRKVVGGPFTKPMLVCSTPFVLLGEADSGRKLGHNRTGIPDPWAEYLAQQTGGRSQLGEENIEIVDTSYHNWGVPLCQGIPDPWKNRPCFLEAGCEKLQKYGNILPCDMSDCPRKHDYTSPCDITNGSRGYGNIAPCDITERPRNYITPQVRQCNCKPQKSPTDVTELPRPKFLDKTVQTVYDFDPDKFNQSNLQKSEPIKSKLNIPNLESSSKAEEPQLNECPGCPPNKRGIFQFYPKAIQTQPTSTPKRRKLCGNRNKNICPISKRFKRRTKTQVSPSVPANKNITDQKHYPVAVPSVAPTVNGDGLVLMCWPNCMCSGLPCKLVCTNANLQDSRQVQIPHTFQCTPTGSPIHNTPNGLTKLSLSPHLEFCDSSMIQPCLCKENTDSSEKNPSPDRNNTKCVSFPQTKKKKLQVAKECEQHSAVGSKHKEKISEKESSSEKDLQELDDEIETHSQTDDELNKIR